MQDQRQSVLVLGANGKVGKHIVKYLIKKYHVIALIRDAPKYGINSPHLEYAKGDAFEGSVINPLLFKVKLVVSCLKPESPRSLEEYTHHLVNSIKSNGNPRLIFIGSLGSLKNKQGKLLSQSNDFPKQLKQQADIHNKALQQIRNSGIQFTVVCAPQIQNGMDDQNAQTAVQKIDSDVKYTVKGGNLGNVVLQEAQNLSHPNQAIGVWDK